MNERGILARKGLWTAGPDAHPGVRWKWAIAQRPAGLLTCGSSRGWPSRDDPSGMFSVARRLQLRGQLRSWRLMATPHRIPYYFRGASAHAKPIAGFECQNWQGRVKRKHGRRMVAFAAAKVAKSSSNCFESELTSAICRIPIRRQQKRHVIMRLFGHSKPDRNNI
ncbi:hypothetical protein SAMN04488030_2526 [Aliiroseovarius halocynthiae]|nr:hypothetical protein SAMN04488030_2526 [Aliiroseovarius halocynthiae]